MTAIRPEIMPRHNSKAGEALVEENLLTASQLDDVLEEQDESGQYLGEIIVENGYAPAEEVYQQIAEQVAVPYADLDSVPIDVSLLPLVPAKLARKFTLMPLYVEDDVLYVAVSDHLDIDALDTVAGNTGYHVEPMLAPPSEISRVIDEYYTDAGNIEEDMEILAEEQTGEEGTEGEEPSEAELEVEASDTPVVRYVNLLIQQAIDKRASDVHIEPHDKGISVRLRIDGVLHYTTPPPKKMFSGIVTRIKILSGLDIGERRIPQDGRFRLEGSQIDVRVSTLPTIYGEKVVMRLLDKSKLMLSMKELGFQPKNQQIYEEALRQPQGIILVTGPTGSGKTTTLYSGLGNMNRDDRNIVTTEDPVEYELEGINQVQVKSKVGLTFAASLRSILRQDPDVIMVGEIRDLETAQMAVRAALTGHLVLSTLHTNNAIATVTRLVDMGVKSFLLGSCLSVVMAQRLVRQICPACKASYDVPPEMRQELDLPDDGEYYHGEGCDQCNDTGYQGREALFEILNIDQEISRLITEEAGEDQIREAARRKGFSTLRERGINKIKQGITTPEEILTNTVGTGDEGTDQAENCDDGQEPERPLISGAAVPAKEADRGSEAPNPSVAERIWWMRAKLDLTQKELADKVGVSSSTVGSWERGRTNPRRDNLRKLRRIMDDIETPTEAST